MCDGLIVVFAEIVELDLKRRSRNQLCVISCGGHSTNDMMGNGPSSAFISPPLQASHPWAHRLTACGFVNFQMWLNEISAGCKNTALPASAARWLCTRCKIDPLGVLLLAASSILLKKGCHLQVEKF